MRYYKSELKEVLDKYNKIDEELFSHKNKLGSRNRNKLYEIETDGKIVDIGKKSKIKPKKQKSNKKKKGIITSVIALVMAGVITGAVFLIVGKLKKKNNDDLTPVTSTSQNIDDLGTGSLDSLGEELQKDEKTNSEYTKVSGNFNIEDLVRGTDGVLYDSQESADNASKVGTTVIDTHNGKYVVGNDGDVYTSENGYEIIDESGNVIESGNGTPNNYEEGISSIECPCNYYDDEGNLVHKVGELITPKELEICKQFYHTTKPNGDEYAVVEEVIEYFDESVAVDETVVSIGSDTIVDENEKEEKEEKEEVTEEIVSTINSSNGIIKADGTYTIYGQTYSSYADYQQYIFGDGSGYGEINGIIQPIGDYEIETQYTR